MLEVRDIVAGYGRGTVLHGLSLSVQRGEVVGILGRNGMGKTSLIRALAGLLRIREGSISLDGTDLSHAPAHARAPHGIAALDDSKKCWATFPGSANEVLRQQARSAVVSSRCWPSAGP